MLATNKRNIAIIFHGLVHRSLKFTVDSFEKKILRPLQKNYNVDVYHHSWVIEKINNPRGGERNIAVDADSIKKYLPYSKGIEENQSDFDATIDKSFFTDKNPMHKGRRRLEDSFITAMNCLRDLESTKRAFDYMDSHKRVEYDYVIVCRPDVEFINTFDIEKAEKVCRKGIIVAPQFDTWGGVNDRFAMGVYSDMREYCNRIDEAMYWMIHGTAKSSEVYLKDYLSSKNIEAQEIPIIFRRIRADGKIFHRDIILHTKNKLLFRMLKPKMPAINYFVENYLPERMKRIVRRTLQPRDKNM